MTLNYRRYVADLPAILSSLPRSFSSSSGSESHLAYCKTLELRYRSLLKLDEALILEEGENNFPKSFRLPVMPENEDSNNKNENDELSVFHEACKSGELDFIQSFVNEHRDLFCLADQNGMTGLHHASKHNQIEAVHILISNGIDINSRDQEMRSALIVAIENCAISVALLLLLNNVDINLPDKNGRTPLHYCVEHDLGTLTPILYRLGANLDAKDKNGKSALHTACEINKPAALKLLISLGCNIDIKDLNGKTPLFRASEVNNLSLVCILKAEGADIDAIDNRDRTAFWKACATGQIAAACLLHSLGANINIACLSKKHSPLYKAIKNNDSKILYFLIDANVDLDTSGINVTLVKNGGVDGFYVSQRGRYLSAIVSSILLPTLRFDARFPFVLFLYGFGFHSMYKNELFHPPRESSFMDSSSSKIASRFSTIAPSCFLSSSCNSSILSKKTVVI